MKKNVLALSFISLLAVCAAAGVSSAPKKVLTANAEELPSGSHTLYVLNVKDYFNSDVIDAFKEAMNEKYGVSDIDVVYEETDTPEKILETITTTPGKYDLICPSDYMIQKMITKGLLTKLDMDEIPYYTQYASRYIKEKKLDPIEATNPQGEIERVGDYAVGYMWGTLGMVFDPNYRGEEYFDKFISDMQSWDIMWNEDYKRLGTIKDSVRDTYAIGLLHGYDKDYQETVDGHVVTKDGFATMKAKYVAGEEGYATREEYNAKFSELFNRCDDTAIAKVNEELNKLMNNVFGLEVDQGKQDIVTGKIGINFAWSGDAVYALDLAEEESDKELYYSVPETGSNAWFDAWCMPKYDDRQASRVTLAHEFLNFISDPEYAAMNMDYTGYTSFIGGESIRDLTIEWYDIRQDMAKYEDDEGEYQDIYYIDPISSEEKMVKYIDCHYEEDTNHQYDNVELYYKDADDNNVSLEEKFNERLTFNEEEMDIEEVDLSYFFNGTLSPDDETGSLFYSDCYLPFTNEDESHNECVGRQFFTQFPDEETLTRCAVMKDFGSQNAAVMAMWERFRSTTLPTWAIVLFSVELGLILFGVGFYFVGKSRKASYKKRRKKEA